MYPNVRRIGLGSPPAHPAGTIPQSGPRTKVGPGPRYDAADASLDGQAPSPTPFGARRAVVDPPVGLRGPPRSRPVLPPGLGEGGAVPGAARRCPEIGRAHV